MCVATVIGTFMFYLILLENLDFLTLTTFSLQKNGVSDMMQTQDLSVAKSLGLSQLGS
jgi:hypothetical protein